MSENKIKTYYLSEKVSKIRWIPQKLMESTRFLTGTWDMPSNSVKIWNFQETFANENREKLEPQCNDKISFNGNITGMEFIDTNLVAVSCSDGRISLLQIKPSVEKDSLELQTQSKVLHRIDTGDIPTSCTGISVYGSQIATVGEDGRLNIIEANLTLKEHSTIQADSCALTCVAYVNPQEVLTASNMGIIRMFDIRDTSSNKQCTSAFMTSIEDDRRSNYISCLVYHPTQPHIILAGAEEGSITVWDLRQPGYPASYLSAHDSAINDMAFHRTDPTKFFTAAEDGELWQWTQQQQPLANYPGMQNDEHMNPWLNGERAKSRLSVTALMSNLRKSINCFDINGSKLLCGSDTEAIYFIQNL